MNHFMKVFNEKVVQKCWLVDTELHTTARANNMTIVFLLF